jgi:hypothetical protein
LVVEISGPGLYDTPEINAHAEWMVTLEDPLKMSDSSWVPDSRYHSDVMAQTEFMNKNAKKIQAAYQKHVKKTQLDQSSSKHVTPFKASMSDLKNPDKQDEEPDKKPNKL